MQTWSDCRKRHLWPVGRGDHSTVCLGYGRQHRRLLIIGGFGDDGTTNNNLWLLDPMSGRMEKVRLSQKDSINISPHQFL